MWVFITKIVTFLKSTILRLLHDFLKIPAAPVMSGLQEFGRRLSWAPFCSHVLTKRSGQWRYRSLSGLEIFWDITLYLWISGSRRFEKPYFLHLHSQEATHLRHTSQPVTPDSSAKPLPKSLQTRKTLHLCTKQDSNPRSLRSSNHYKRRWRNTSV